MKNYSALELGMKMNVFIKDGRSDKPFEGKVWPGLTYFPDFTPSNRNVSIYWEKMLRDFHSILPVDGIWLDMNDPSNFFIRGTRAGCAGNSLNNPPYTPVNYVPFYRKTVCMDAKHADGSPHIATHNFYGHYENMRTHEALKV